MSTNLIVANILSLISNGINGISSFFKTKKSILLIQTLECTIGGISQLLCKSFSAAIQLFICAIRNFITVNKNTKKIVYWLFSLAFLVLGHIFNNRGLIGLLPIFATIQFTLWNGYFKTAQQVRYGMVINFIPWIIHDFVVKMYVSAIIMTILMFVTIVNIIRYRNIKEQI